MLFSMYFFMYSYIETVCEPLHTMSDHNETNAVIRMLHEKLRRKKLFLSCFPHPIQLSPISLDPLITINRRNEEKYLCTPPFINLFHFPYHSRSRKKSYQATDPVFPLFIRKICCCGRPTDRPTDRPTAPLKNRNRSLFAVFLC